MTNYIFKSGKHKGKTIRWVKRADLKYLIDIVSGALDVKLPQNIIDYIEKLCEGRCGSESVIIDEIIEKYKEGYKKSEVIEFLLKRKYTPVSAEQMITKASVKIKSSFEEDKSYMIGLHLKRYDGLYSKHINLSSSLVGPKFRFKRIDHYILAMDSLLAKEKLLGLHSKKYNIQLNNFIGGDRALNDAGYSFMNLTLEELIELSQLVTECKSVNHEEKHGDLLDNALFQVGEVTKKIIEEIEDIEHEEVPSPLSMVNHEDRFVDNIIATRKSKGSILLDVEKKIEKNNQSLFEKMLADKIKKK